MRDQAMNIERAKQRVAAERDALKAPRQAPPKPTTALDVPYGIGGAGYLNSLSPAYRGLRPSAHLPSLSTDPITRQLTPTIIPPIYTPTELGLLRQRLHRAENEILLREESCKVCGKIFTPFAEGTDAVRQIYGNLQTIRPDSGQIRNHYRTHAPPSPRRCPCEGCSENLEDRIRYPTFDVSINSHRYHQC